LNTTADDILVSVESTIRRHAMLRGGETVLAAVSGGSDSVALLYLLHRLAPAWRLTLHALYVDHQLRSDSGRDGEFVCRLAARLDVPAETATVSVVAGGSREAAARAARYRALEDYADRIGAQRIALGHTSDDQAETVLMRILEGTGVRGLAGIPARRGPIIRPLLAERRTALRALLSGMGVEWLEDPWNEDRRFVRNRIRHELLPLLAEFYNAEIVPALVRVATLAGTTVDAVERVAAQELERLATAAPGELILPLGELQALPGEVAAEVLRQAAAILGSRAPLRAWAHRGLRRALAHPPPRRAFALGRVTVDVSVGRLRLASHPPASLTARDIPVPGCMALPEADLMLESALLPRSGYEIPRDPWRVAFDVEALPGPLIVRARRPGDRLTPFGTSGERRVKRLLLEAGRPRWERQRVPIVQAGPEIAWVGGVRRGSVAPVTALTRRILQLSLFPLAEARGPR
jgi:tRNA(Ile)-lysidine synthase